MHDLATSLAKAAPAHSTLRLSVRPSRYTGVMVLTGVNNVEAFALGSTFGVGFEYTIGAGVAIFTGSPFNEYNGLYFFVRFPSSVSLFLLPPFLSSFFRTTHILPLTTPSCATVRPGRDHLLGFRCHDPDGLSLF